MKLGQIKLFLLLTIIPLFGIFSQIPNHSPSFKQFNPKQLYSIPLHSRDFNPNKYINKYFSSYNTNKIKNSSSFLDSIVEICQPPNGNQKYIFYYDNAGRVNYFITQAWYNNKWDNSLRNTYSYDSLGNLSGELTELLSAGQWIPWHRVTNTYDEKRNQISNLTEDYIDSQWVNSYQFLNQYDTSGDLLNQLNMQWDGKEWITNYQAIFFFKEGVRDSLLFQDWIDGQWVNDKSAKPEYDNQGNLITMLWKTWSDTQWVNYVRGNWNFGLYRNIVSGLVETWDGTQWINDYRFSYSYNSDNNFTHGLNEIWQNETWIPGDRQFYFSRPDIFNEGFSCTDLSVYYKNTSGVEKSNTIKGYSLSQNYPNPFNPSTVISYTLPSSSNIKFIIYNTLGQTIKILESGYKQLGNYSINFNAFDLPSGIYFYKLEAGQFSQVKKMILIK